MKFIRIWCIVFLVTILFSSCPVNEDKSKLKIFYKSTFLGSDSFTLSGRIYDRNGKPKLGNKIIVKIEGYEEDWSFEENINGNNFLITINKTDNDERTLPSSDQPYNYDTAWDIFTVYYSGAPTPGQNSPERDKKMYRLQFFLDSYTDDYTNAIGEFTKTKPERYSDERIWYVYIPETLNIYGIYTWEDELWINYASFDCDFSRIGWYKIIEKVTDPLDNNPLYVSSTNVKFF